MSGRQSAHNLPVVIDDLCVEKMRTVLLHVLGCQVLNWRGADCFPLDTSGSFVVEDPTVSKPK